MLLSKEILDKDVEANYADMFGDVKLNKKAETKVRALMSYAVGLAHKLTAVDKLHKEAASVHNAIASTLNYKFVKPEVADESSSKED